jgi:hypothetical protein
LELYAVREFGGGKMSGYQVISRDEVNERTNQDFLKAIREIAEKEHDGKFRINGGMKKPIIILNGKPVRKIHLEMISYDGGIGTIMRLPDGRRFRLTEDSYGVRPSGRLIFAYRGVEEKG